MEIKLTGQTEATIERGLAIAAERHRLAAANVANIDTPGYKPSHLSFADILDRIEVEGAAPELPMARTDARHLGAGALGGTPQITVDDTARRPDGNGVDPEREMSDLSQNGIYFASLAQAFAARLKILKAAVTEGR